MQGLLMCPVARQKASDPTVILNVQNPGCVVVPGLVMRTVTGQKLIETTVILVVQNPGVSCATTVHACRSDS
jgi:hypothetical protein